LKEPHVYVRSEYIDVAEGRISQTCHRTAVMQEFPYFVPAFSHLLKPLMRDGSQFTCMLSHPDIDGRSPLDSAVESQQFRSHRHGILRATCWFQGGDFPALLAILFSGQRPAPVLLLYFSAVATLAPIVLLFAEVHQHGHAFGSEQSTAREIRQQNRAIHSRVR